MPRRQATSRGGTLPAPSDNASQRFPDAPPARDPQPPALRSPSSAPPGRARPGTESCRPAPSRVAGTRPVKPLRSTAPSCITKCDHLCTGEQGAAVSSGTSGEYWADKALPSVFKHELLRRYLPQFGGMTGAQSHDRRVVYLDGYAGEGRYENGQPASGEIALQVASDLHKSKRTLECFFSEAQPKSYTRLEEVVQQYRASGV
ncbi:three-Cys-motif partner protein TcmP, partial [Streptomyces sp. SID8373]|nr:three-Cys-motif partner protein TcmP [Streptomyces sp. SID8373]